MKKRLTQISLLTAVVAVASCDKPPVGMGSMSSRPDTSAAIDTGSPVVASTAPTPSPTPTPEATTKPAEPAPTGAPKAGMMMLEPEFPQPLFAGTPLPQNNPPPNLDKSGKPVTGLEVPAGSTLVSKGKTVTSSDTAPFTGELKFLTDGDKDGSDGYFVELAPGVQWVQIDLGESKEVDAVWMWHFHKQGVIYQDVIVGVSDDPDFKNPKIIFNNDYDNTQQMGAGTDQSYVETNHGRPIKAPAGTKGRYVRLYSNGRYMDEMNHYIEVEVYGH